MLFESADSPFSGISPMAARGDHLALHVICGEKTFQSCGGRIVQGLKFGVETLGS
jgi:hypothetical protein